MCRCLDLRLQAWTRCLPHGGRLAACLVLTTLCLVDSQNHSRCHHLGTSHSCPKQSLRTTRLLLHTRMMLQQATKGSRTQATLTMCRISRPTQQALQKNLRHPKQQLLHPRNHRRSQIMMRFDKTACLNQERMKMLTLNCRPDTTGRCTDLYLMNRSSLYRAGLISIP